MLRVQLLLCVVLAMVTLPASPFLRRPAVASSRASLALRRATSTADEKVSACFDTPS
jgi:hypothetical protein